MRPRLDPSAVRRYFFPTCRGAPHQVDYVCARHQQHKRDRTQQTSNSVFVLPKVVKDGRHPTVSRTPGPHVLDNCSAIAALRIAPSGRRRQAARDVTGERVSLPIVAVKAIGSQTSASSEAYLAGIPDDCVVGPFSLTACLSVPAPAPNWFAISDD
jgi:hypothetical protein